MHESDAPHASLSTTDGDTFVVTIERILPGGLGLAHADGRTVMVALAAPGDRLRVRTERVKGGVAFASIVEVLEPSPVRVEPPCPYFGRCGGCDFQQLNYQAQLDAKVAIVRDCLHRIAHLEAIPEFEIVRAPNEWRYRARAHWQYDSRTHRLGYFEANSHSVCDVAECAVLVPELQSDLERLRAQMKAGELPEEVRYFRAIAGDESVAVAAGGRSPTYRGRHAGNSRGLVDREGAGSDQITRTIRGERYRLSAQSFFQTNIDLLPALIDYALGDVGGSNAVELYCGVGLFTVPLARRFETVTAVEDDADATEFARANLTAASLRNAEVVNCDVADWLEESLERGGKAKRRQRLGSSRGLDRPVADANEKEIQSAVKSTPREMLARGTPPAGARQKAGALQIDFLLLDPPRTGAESRVINGIVNLKPERICYVSCDPATLARDLKKLIAAGYRIDRMRAFDMFPQTHHVETVVQLDRNAA